MTVQASNLESEHLPYPTGHSEGPLESVLGKSPTRLAMARFRKDRLSMAAFEVVALYILAAVAAPFLVKFRMLAPFSFHQEQTDPATGGIRYGKWGGISWSHPLGV